MPLPLLIEGLDNSYVVLCWHNGVQAALGPDGRWRSNRPATEKRLNERYSPIPDRYRFYPNGLEEYARKLADELEAEIIRWPKIGVHPLT